MKTFFAKLFTTKTGELKNLKYAPYNGGKEINDDLLSELINKPRLAIALILDISGSMRGKKLESLMQGCKEFILQAKKDDEANSRIDLKIIAFSDKWYDVLDWTPLYALNAYEPELVAGGLTSLGGVTRYGWSETTAHKKVIKSQGPTHHRCINIIITDGKATDNMTGIKEEAERLEETEGLQTWALGIPDETGNADKVAETLSLYFKRTFKNSTMDVTEFLRWASKGMVKLSKSAPGETVEYEELPENVTFIERKTVPSNFS